MGDTALKPSRSWFPQWAAGAIVSVLLSAGAWVLCATRIDAASATEIAAIKERQAEQDKRIDQKLSKEEFQQFTKGLDERLTLIQTNTELLVKMQKRERR